MKIRLTETFVTLLASTAVAASIASPVMAKSNHKPTHQGAAVVQHRDPAGATSASASPKRVAHSPNPAWDVYDHSGQYIGSDPDPRIRALMLVSSGYKS